MTTISILTTLISAAFAPASEDGYYHSTRAELPIESKSKIEIPRGGERALSVKVTYPTAKGNYPIIVFSHGMYGSEDGNTPLVETWAKAGYVVFQPTHADSLRYATAEVRRAALQGSLNNAQNWRERPGEISLVLDKLDWFEQQVPALKGKLNKKVIGMAGHSFGAWTTQMVAGMTLGRGGMTINLGDKRPKAFIAFSPSGLGGGITESSFQTMRSPFLYITGDNDKGNFQNDPKVHRREAFDLAPKGDRTLVWIKDVYHNFGGINGRELPRMAANRLSGPGNPTHVKIAVNSSLAYWDAQLKNLPEARAFWKRPLVGVDGVKVETK